jgi:hypothetical protein
VSYSGSIGYARGGVGIGIRWASSSGVGYKTIDTTHTDNQGNFSGIFIVPNVPLGQYRVEAVSFATMPATYLGSRYFSVKQESEETLIFKRPEYGVLFDVHVLSTGEGLAVGESGTALYYDGRGWTRVWHKFTSYNLWAVHGTSPEDFWAVSSNAIYHYDGHGWRLSASGDGWRLRDICMLPSGEGWAVGKVILHYKNGSWNTEYTGKQLYSIDMLSATEGWAVGQNVLLHWNGSSWVEIEEVLPVAEHMAVDAVSANDVWVATAGTAMYHYDGQSWQPVPVHLAQPGIIRSIDMVSSQVG